MSISYTWTGRHIIDGSSRVPTAQSKAKSPSFRNTHRPPTSPRPAAAGNPLALTRCSLEETKAKIAAVQRRKTVAIALPPPPVGGPPQIPLPALPIQPSKPEIEETEELETYHIGPAYDADAFVNPRPAPLPPPKKSGSSHSRQSSSASSFGFHSRGSSSSSTTEGRLSDASNSPHISYQPPPIPSSPPHRGKLIRKSKAAIAAAVPHLDTGFDSGRIKAWRYEDMVQAQEPETAETTRPTSSGSLNPFKGGVFYQKKYEPEVMSVHRQKKFEHKVPMGFSIG